MSEGGVARQVQTAPHTRREPTAHQLRSFLVICEEMHLGRAAARLCVTQPALSQQLHALEERLGVRLTERTSRGLRLTRAGEVLLPEIRTAVRAMQGVRRTAEALSRALDGHLMLGTIGAETAMPYTKAILGDMRECHPQVEVTVRSLDFVEQFDALVHGHIDAAFLRAPVPPELRSIALFTEKRLLCVSTNDPLATAPSVCLAELGGHLVVDIPGAAPRAWWDDWCVNPRPDGSRVGFGPAVEDIEEMLSAVAAGQAVTFLPAAARDLYPRPGVGYVEVADLPPAIAVLAWAADREPGPCLAALLDIARARAPWGL